jgi:hypothetical protein
VSEFFSLDRKTFQVRPDKTFSKASLYSISIWQYM